MADRIALYLPSLVGGGAEQVTVTLANELAERGFAVDLVLADASGPYLKEVSPAVRIVDLDAGRVLFSLPALVRYLRRERPRALLSGLHHANVVAVWAVRRARTPTVLVVAEHNTLTASSAYRRRRIPSMPWLMRRAYPRADAVVAVSKGVADDLAATLGLPRERVHVIYNPIVTDELLAMSRAPVDHPWCADGAPPMILAVGRLTEQKDFPTLIHAYARLRRRRSVRLVILGEGEARGELEDLIARLGLAEDVYLPGFVDNPFAWMRQARLFALSSRWEGLPSVLIQAMACGTQVVSTDCPSGPAEILEGGRWGRLVPVGDAEALAAALDAALDDDEDVRAAVEIRARDFSVEPSVLGYLAVLGLKSPASDDLQLAYGP